MVSPQDDGSRHRPAAKGFVLGAFVVFVLAEFVYWLPRDLRGTGIDIWVYSDWLIDYSTGFVRRGLSGQFIWWLSGWVSPTVTLTVLMWAIFGVVAAGYLRLIARAMDRLDAVVLAGLLFLPSLLPFYLYDQDGALGRKEMLGFVFILWHLHLLQRSRDTDGSAYLKRLVPLYAVALPVHIFVHEATLIQFVPVHLLLSEAALRRDPAIRFHRRFLCLAFLGFPVLLASLIVARFGAPTLERVLAIYRHWNSIGAWKAWTPVPVGTISAKTLPGSLSALFWTPAQVAAITLGTSLRSFLYWGFVFSILGFFTAWLGCTATSALGGVRLARGLDPGAFADGRSRRILGRYFVLPFLASLPLYVVGWDFGRWFAITCFTYVLIALSPGVSGPQAGAGRPPAVGPGLVVGAGATLAGGTLRFYLPVAALLLAVCFLRMPHCFISLGNMFAWPLEALFRKWLHLPLPAAHPALAYFAFRL